MQLSTFALQERLFEQRFLFAHLVCPSAGRLPSQVGFLHEIDELSAGKCLTWRGLWDSFWGIGLRKRRSRQETFFHDLALQTIISRPSRKPWKSMKPIPAFPPPRR
jgi:hypothetical protein